MLKNLGDTKSAHALAIRSFARAALLAGKGWPAERIAVDVMIESVPAFVRSHLREVGIVPSEVDGDRALIPVPSRTVLALNSAAR